MARPRRKRILAIASLGSLACLIIMMAIVYTDYRAHHEGQDSEVVYPADKTRQELLKTTQMNLATTLLEFNPDT